MTKNCREGASESWTNTEGGCDPPCGSRGTTWSPSLDGRERTMQALGSRGDWDVRLTAPAKKAIGAGLSHTAAPRGHAASGGGWASPPIRRLVSDTRPHSSWVRRPTVSTFWLARKSRIEGLIPGPRRAPMGTAGGLQITEGKRGRLMHGHEKSPESLRVGATVSPTLVYIYRASLLLRMVFPSPS